MKNIKKIAAVLLAAIMLFSSICITAFADDAAPIDKVELFVSAPMPGEAPSEIYDIIAQGCNVYSVKWRDAQTGAVMDENTVFAEGDSYTVTIQLAAKEGYEFDADITATINAYEAEVTVNENADTATVSYTFDNAKEASDVLSNILTLLKTVLLTFVRFLGALIGLS